MGDRVEDPWRRVERAASRALGAGRLTDPRDLGGSPRTHVWRCAGGEASYVVKAYREPDNSNGAREMSALEALGEVDVAVPRLHAVVDDPPLVVMGDLGTGPSLADLVLGTDRDAALVGLDGWVDALAGLHASSQPDLLADFAGRLGRRAPGLAVDYTRAEMVEAADKYEDLVRPLGIDPTGLRQEMAALPDLLSDDLAMTPADTCPDNNLVAPDGTVTLLDFEGAAARHPAWDLAYLRVPWPSCWCAWRLPADVVDAAVDRYRERTPRPWAGSEAAERDLDLATSGWCLVSSAWFLEGALGGEDTARAGKPRPGRRTMVLNRLALARTLPGPGPLRDFAGRLHDVLLERWGEHPLAMAPAFT